MKQKTLYFLPLSLLFIMLSFSFESCTDMGYQPPGDYISGWAIVIDTNLLPGGYYAISMYQNKANAFDTLPLRSDSLKLVKDYNSYRSYFRFSSAPKGSYYFAVTWIAYPVPQHDKFPVLGTWRCDTNRNCTNHELISFPNFTGANYNIFCWADTSYKLN